MNKHVFLAPPIFTPRSSPSAIVPDDNIQEKSKQSLGEDTKPSSPSVGSEKQLNQTPARNYIEENSSSNEALPDRAVENTVALEAEDVKSEKNSSVHSSSSSQLEQRFVPLHNIPPFIILFQPT